MIPLKGLLQFIEPFFVPASRVISSVKKNILPARVGKNIPVFFYPHPEFPSNNIISLSLSEKPWVLSSCLGHLEDFHIEAPLRDPPAEDHSEEREFRGDKPQSIQVSRKTAEWQIRLLKSFTSVRTMEAFWGWRMQNFRQFP